MARFFLGAQMKTVLRIALLSLICISLLTPNKKKELCHSNAGPRIKTILNLYDAFGYQTARHFLAGIFRPGSLQTERRSLSTLATGGEISRTNVKAARRDLQPG